MRYAIWISAVMLSFGIGWSGVRWLMQPSAALPPVQQPHSQQPVSTPLAAVSDDPPASAVAISGNGRAESIAALLKQPLGFARDHALLLAIRSWQPADFPKGAAEMLELIKQEGNGIGSAGEHIAEAWLDHWLQLDAPAALKYLEESTFLADLPGVRSMSSISQSPLGGAFRALLRHRPEWLRTMVVEMEPGPRRNIAAQILIGHAARGGIAQAQPYLADFPHLREAALIGYVHEAAASDPTSALDAVLAEPPGGSREELLAEIFTAAGARDLALGRGMLDRIEDPALRVQMAASLLSGAERGDPQETVNLVREESERLVAAGKQGPDAVSWVRSGLNGLTAESLQGIADWATDFAADPDHALLADVTRVWASRDAAKFQAWLSTNASRLDPIVTGKLRYALDDMAANRLPLMEEWIATLPEGPLRNQAQFRVSLRTTADGGLANPQAAYRPLADSDTTGALAGELAFTLLEADPAAAGDWALRHTTGEARKVALRTIAEQWSSSDPVGAGQWVAQLPAGSDRDIVVQKYATSAMLANPSAAAEWALQVGDPKGRQETMDSVMHAWQIWDPVTARAWYRQAPGLGAEAYQKLLRLAQ